MLAESIPGTCFKSTEEKGKAALCIQAKAGDEDGKLAAEGVRVRWISADKFKEEGNPQEISEVGSWLNFKEQGLRTWPEAQSTGVKNEDTGEMEKKAVFEGLGKGA